MICLVATLRIIRVCTATRGDAPESLTHVIPCLMPCCRLRSLAKADGSPYSLARKQSLSLKTSISALTVYDPSWASDVVMQSDLRAHTVGSGVCETQPEAELSPTSLPGSGIRYTWWCPVGSTRMIVGCLPRKDPQMDSPMTVPQSETEV
ncbi:hypothetical protein Tco_1576266 [Tanacetum coccineum]